MAKYKNKKIARKNKIARCRLYLLAIRYSNHTNNNKKIIIRKNYVSIYFHEGQRTNVWVEEQVKRARIVETLDKHEAEQLVKEPALVKLKVMT